MSDRRPPTDLASAARAAIHDVIEICRALQAEERRWSAWHDAEVASDRWQLLNATLMTPDPEAPCLSCSEGQQEARRGWSAWSRWLTGRPRLNVAPDILADSESRLPDELFALPLAHVVGYLAHIAVPDRDRDTPIDAPTAEAAAADAGEDATTARDSDTARAEAEARPGRPEVDAASAAAREVSAATGAQTFDVQALTFLHLYVRRTLPEFQTASCDGPSPRSRMLWQQVVVIQNAPLPLFTRAWLTRALYENALPDDRRVDDAEIDCVADRDDDDDDDRREGDGTELMRQTETWARRLRAEFGATACETASCVLWETSVQEDATPFRRACLAAARRMIAPAPLGNELNADRAAQVRALVAQNSARPSASASAVLLHALHATNVILLLHEVAAATWTDMSARRRTNRSLLMRLRLDLLAPLLTRLGHANALRLLGLPDIDPIRQQSELVDADLEATVVELGRALHMQTAMTLPQLRRCTATFWAMCPRPV